MNRYGADPAAIRGLVRPDCVHRDVYRDPELFELEMTRLWLGATHGKCQAGVLRCPYHGWTYRLDAALPSIELLL
jgi:hypothetical protein